jgi:undecaprenyl-diphosphatase
MLPVINAFDHSITLFVNQYVGRSWLFDSLVVFLSDQDFLKGGVALSLFWFAWIQTGGNATENRRRLLAMLVACTVALTLGQVLQVGLPFRLRPLHTPELALTLPLTLPPKSLDGWSSLPSDHATLFFTISTGLMYVSRSLGLWSLAHTIVIVCLPRLYLGLHFASDLIVGALIGMASSYLLCYREYGASVVQFVLNWEKRFPAALHAGLFLITLQFATLFNDIRAIAAFVLTTARTVIGR